jgi:hypothetical protein
VREHFAERLASVDSALVNENTFPLPAEKGVINPFPYERASNDG